MPFDWKEASQGLNQSYVLSHYYNINKKQEARFFRTTLDLETLLEIIVCSMMMVFEKQEADLTQDHALEILKRFGVTDASEEFAGKEVFYVLKDNDPRWNDFVGVLDAPPNPQFEGEKVLHLDLFELWERHPINTSSEKSREAMDKYFGEMSDDIFSDRSFYQYTDEFAQQQAYFVAYGEEQQDGIFFRSDASLLSVLHRVMLIQQAVPRPLKEAHLLDLFKNFFHAGDAMDEFKRDKHTYLMDLPKQTDEKVVYEFLSQGEGEDDVVFIDLSKLALADENIIPELERTSLPTDEVFVEELQDDYFYRKG